MKILVAGDYVPAHRFGACLEKGQLVYDYEIIKKITNTVDYSILNLEAPIVKGDEQPICKFGPNLKAPINSINGIKGMGFDAVTLASNHFRDYGSLAIAHTLQLLNEANVDYVGGGNDIYDAAKVIKKEFRNEIISIINCCEHEFSIATETRAGAMPLDIVKVYHSIIEAKQISDYVVVIVHGGNEWYPLPSPRMKQLYRFFVEVGADAVVNHHQHCYSGYEYFQGKPIVYGLGNFIFDNPTRRGLPWNEGYFVVLNLNSTQINIELVPYRQCDEKPGAYPMVGEEKESFFENIEHLNSIIEDDIKLNSEFERFMLGKSKGIFSMIGPFKNKYIRALVSHGVIPSFVSNKKATMLFNYISCEAHRDVTLYALENIIK